MIARVHRFLVGFFLCVSLQAEQVRIPGLEQPVEVLRDRWGVPHIYAKNTHDLFFAQGYITATDRLWQIDMWRRVGTGKLAEVLGPSAIRRDQLARAVQYRGDWDAALQWIAVGDVTVNDRGTQRAPGYGLVNLELTRRRASRSGTWATFARVDNAFDRRYVGSVIVNEGSARYYEPGPDRTFAVGVRWDWKGR